MSQRRFTPQQQQRNPKDRGPKPPFEEPGQSFPGLEEKMRSKPDHGEESYRGNGRLKGKTALITGGDSGLGRAVAIAFAREGADVVISCLPEEKAEAQDAAAGSKKPDAELLLFQAICRMKNGAASSSIKRSRSSGNLTFWSITRRTR